MRKIEINFEAKQPNVNQINNMAATFKPEILKDIYSNVSRALTKRHKLTTIRTHAELHLVSKIKKATKLQVFTGVWIGRFCVDIFIPGIGGNVELGKRKMKGLVIEVNGDVHNIEPKMVKDENRVKVLGDLGIGVLNIENADIDSPEIEKLISQIKDLPRLSWRPRQRVWTRVQAWTIIANNAIQYEESDESL